MTAPLDYQVLECACCQYFGDDCNSSHGSTVQAYEEQTRELRVAVKAAHREGEYQASMAMRSLQEKMAAAMQRSDAATAQLAEYASNPNTQPYGI